MSPRALASLWIPPLALMGLIFFLSAQPDLASSRGLVDLVARKVIHAAEYGVLCLLWWLALRPLAGERKGLLAAIAVAVVYAVTDEFHQTFVPGRLGTPVDVAIDAVGAGVAAAGVHWLRRGASAREPAPANLPPTASRAG